MLSLSLITSFKGCIFILLTSLELGGRSSIGEPVLIVECYGGKSVKHKQRLRVITETFIERTYTQSRGGRVLGLELIE